MRNLRQMPSRIRYYLLDWKDRNTDIFHTMYGDVSLNDLSIKDLYGLFKFASEKDYVCFNISGKHIEDENG